MSEKPILFNGEMVQAILDGRKTQDRRVIKPQPDYSHLKAGVELEAHKCPQLGPVHIGRQEWGLYGKPYHPSDVPCYAYDCPYGQPGDRLWVRETWGRYEKADGEILYLYITDCGPNAHVAGGWRPSIHMPKAAARLWLRVIDIRVEQVQDICLDDIEAEGIPQDIFKQGIAFRKHWDSINAKRGYGWNKNPFVWVVVFEREEIA